MQRCTEAHTEPVVTIVDEVHETFIDYVKQMIFFKKHAGGAFKVSEIKISMDDSVDKPVSMKLQSGGALTLNFKSSCIVDGIPDFDEKIKKHM